VRVLIRVRVVIRVRDLIRERSLLISIASVAEPEDLLRISGSGVRDPMKKSVVGERCVRPEEVPEEVVPPRRPSEHRVVPEEVPEEVIPEEVAGEVVSRHPLRRSCPLGLAGLGLLSGVAGLGLLSGLAGLSGPGQREGCDSADTQVSYVSNRKKYQDVSRNIVILMLHVLIIIKTCHGIL